MRSSNPYLKGFLGSLVIHVTVLFFLILSFNQRVPLSSAASEPIIEAVMVDASDLSLALPEKTPELVEVEKLKKQVEYTKKEEAQASQLRKDMLAAKNKASKQETSEVLHNQPAVLPTPSVAVQDPVRMAAQEEQFAEQARLKEQKKRAQHLKEQQALKAQEALKAKETALKKKLALEKARVAEQKSKMAAEKARLAAHQKEIDTEIGRVLLAWTAKITSHRRSMIEFQNLPSDLSCKVNLRILPDGSVQARLLQSSGHALYDSLAMKAIYKAEPFVLPDNPEVQAKIKDIDFNFLNDE